ncbi:MAG: hypothetical protein ABIP03_14135 [Aquihabitans sp.]
MVATPTDDIAVGAGHPPSKVPIGTAKDKSGKTGSSITSERAATWTFGIYVAAALPLLIFKLGSYFWFFRDDWFFITGRELSSVDDVFRPHNGHWTTVPVVIFRVLYRLFGIRSYVPYQFTVVVAHLGVAVLLRVIMRRSGVGPWLATAAAGSLVLFGAGREDIIWAFQVGYTGSVFFVLAQWILADHRGDIDKRDWLAVGCGVLALMAGSPPIPILMVMGVALLIRRGWRAAAFQTIPTGAVYLSWMLVTHPQQSSPFGRPTARVMGDWVWSGQIATFQGIGHYQLVAVLMALLTVVGVILALFGPASSDHRLADLTPGDASKKAATGRPLTNVIARVRRRLYPVATPLCLFLGSVIFMTMAAQSRWFAGAQAARASRYLYIYAVLTLPLIALAAQAIVQRWKFALPIVAPLLVAGIPANISAFDAPPFGPSYHQHQEAILLNAVRTRYSRRASPDLRPIPDVFNSPGLNMAFLLGAYDTGKLVPPAGPIPERVSAELSLIFGLKQTNPTGIPTCNWLEGPQRLQPAKGQEFVLQSDAAVRINRNGKFTQWPVFFRPGEGSLLTVERDGMDLMINGAMGAPLKLCEVR